MKLSVFHFVVCLVSSKVSHPFSHHLYVTGVSALGSVFRPTIDAEGMSVVEAAVKAGINWFDAAPWYGHGKGETVFGRVILSYVCLTTINYFIRDNPVNHNDIIYILPAFLKFQFSFL